MDDVRARLHEADRLVRDGQYAEAVSAYMLIADHFADTGVPLKRVAILKQVVKLIDDAAPALADARSRATEQLAAIQVDLGLSADGVRIRPRSDPKN
jgi:hypothetical protein